MGQHSLQNNHCGFTDPGKIGSQVGIYGFNGGVTPVAGGVWRDFVKYTQLGFLHCSFESYSLRTA